MKSFFLILFSVVIFLKLDADVVETEAWRKKFPENKNVISVEPWPIINTSYEKINKIIYKGTNKDIDSYSGFYDNAKGATTHLSE